MAAGGPFESLYADPKALENFQRAMFALSYPTALMASERIDFSPFKKVMDIGGGTGGFVNAICERHDGIEATIFDLPPVEGAARTTIARHGNEGRIDFVHGDFFNDPLPEGYDLIALGDILHDWDEAQGTALLEKAYAALPDQGAVVVLENLLGNEKDGPPMSSFINLTMLVAAYGKQRSPEELAEWLGRIGFKRFEHHFLPAPRDVFIAWKT